MVRKLGELSNFFVFNSRIESLGNSSVFVFSYYCSLYTDFCIYFSDMINLGLVMFSWLCFQMNMSDYPHITIAKDGRLCSTG
jgi:hypothetical protein